MRKLTIIAAFFLSLASCKKDENESNKDILQKHTWRRQSLWINGVSQQLAACAADDYLKFTENSLEINAGSQKCDPTEPQSIISNYSMSADQKEIYITNASAGNFTYKINSLNHTSLEVDISTSSGTNRVLFVAQ